MIQLNLIPESLKKKEPKFKFDIPRENLILVCAGAIILLIIAHSLLAGIGIIKGCAYKVLSSNWNTLQPEKDKVDFFIKEIGSFDNKAKSIEGVTSGDRILWSQKLNRISDILPSGIWLRWIMFQANNLTIEGSSVSKKGKEIILVNKFSAALKKDAEFYKDCASSEVVSIKRRQIKNIEVVDFVIETYLK